MRSRLGPCDSATMAGPPNSNQPTLPAAPAPHQGIGALARLQRLLAGAVLASAVGWLLGWWRYSKTVALGGAALIALGHVWVLAFECAASRSVNRRFESAPQPGVAAWLRAWAIECIHTPRVFYWRQPFFSNAVPDQLPVGTSAGQCSRRGVVLIHGFVCNRGFWTPWLRRLQAAGHPFVAVNLEPIAASIDDYAPIIEQAVQRVTAASGQPPLLLCHSMGGLAARAWLRQAGAGAPARVQHIVTIGTPHHGTWLGNWSAQRNGRQMARHSEWLAALRDAEPAGLAECFTCWHSNCDNIVFPASTATLAGADNRLLRGLPHVALGFQPQVMAQVFERLAQDAQADRDA